MTWGGGPEAMVDPPHPAHNASKRSKQVSRPHFFLEFVRRPDDTGSDPAIKPAASMLKLGTDLRDGILPRSDLSS
jgi:hypothetical protein